MSVKVLFVCMGNICRSPTAHAVMQHKLNERDLHHLIEVDSAGTHAYHVGEKSDSRSRQKAASKGVDMEYIRARKIAITDHDDFDYILAMDSDNLELIEYYAPSDAKARVALFLSFANSEGLANDTVVPDPYYGGDAGFEHVFSLVDKGCDALINHIRKTDLAQ